MPDTQSTSSVSIWIAALASLAIGFALGACMSIVIDQPPADVAALRAELATAKTDLQKSGELLAKAKTALEENVQSFAEVGTLRTELADAKRRLKQDAQVIASYERLADTDGSPLGEDLELTIKVLKRQLAQAAERGNTPASKEDYFDNFEENFRRIPSWMLLTDEDPTVRMYGHPTGVRVKCWELEDGTQRAWFRYRPTDEKESGMAMGVWLLLSSIGGEAFAVENGDRISAWFDNPEEILLLKGGFIHALVGADNAMEINLYCPR